MSDLNSSLLFIGTQGKAADELGADCVLSIEEVESRLVDNRYSVIILAMNSQLMQHDSQIIDLISTHNPHAQTVLIHGGLPTPQLLEIVNKLRPFKVVADVDQKVFKEAVQGALEQFSLFEQNSQLLELISGQNEKLLRLSRELESRVEKRQKYLANAKEKLQASNTRVEALHRALVAIHQADSIYDLEKLLHSALAGGLNLTWIKILFKFEEYFEQQQEFGKYEVFSAPLVQGGDHIGQIYFARDKKTPFKKEDHNFLIQVSDAASLALDRLNHLEQAKTLKRQWESTFDAITAPLSLVSADHKILRCNQAYARQAGQPITEIIGKSCYKTIFKRNSPCPQCNLGQSFRLAPQKTGQKKSFTFEVSTQQLNLPVTQQKSFVVVYHDVTEQKRWERQLIESAKMAEIGTIGSSIAHELNNPLGGMLSFLQLVKADLKGDENFFEDIVEMEKGAQTCKEIVQDLLSFSRSPTMDLHEKGDLREIIQRAVKLTELQTRSKGIDINLNLSTSPMPIQGQKNMLSQAFRHILQNICESQSAFLDENPNEKGLIEISTTSQEDAIAIELKANLPGKLHKVSFENIKELSLSITNQIIVEHAGTLEVFSQGEKNSLFRATLPRPET